MLETLRSRLNQLRRRRAVVRQTIAWSAVVLAVLWLTAAVFVLDLLLFMDIPQRLVALLLSALFAGWVFWRYTKPWIGVREDLVDVALLVEKHQHIDSDLVAALQFQETECRPLGFAAVGVGGHQLRGRVQPVAGRVRGLYLSPLQTPIGLARGHGGGVDRGNFALSRLRRGVRQPNALGVHAVSHRHPNRTHRPQRKNSICPRRRAGDDHLRLRHAFGF